MKTVVAALVLAALGMAPGVGADCGDHDASAAPMDVGMTTIPADVKAPVSVVAKAPATLKQKKVVDKAKVPAPEQKLAASAGTPAQ